MVGSLSGKQSTERSSLLVKTGDTILTGSGLNVKEHVCLQKCKGEFPISFS